MELLSGKHWKSFQRNLGLKRIKVLEAVLITLPTPPNTPGEHIPCEEGYNCIGTKCMHKTTKKLQSKYEPSFFNNLPWPIGSPFVSPYCEGNRDDPR